ncbi:TadE/TadG family type IV pilus assembly protein [Acidisoma silvae]|uniref:Pilus assembly protein n=1 Tax=Acidisoma silvae TaxID=2802396 RepID=A0A963YSW2_9PROT|nr:TadE/TadG family type IV pilus assembly protein [Acidisoma silvae]MCB8875907.1 pilus assembly protein [Acidisoma silvae]
MSGALYDRRRSGVAAVEFALCLPLLMIMMGGITDLSLEMRSKMLLATGVSNAASEAIATKGSATAATLQTLVTDSSGLTGVTTTVSALAYECASGTPATLKASSSGSTCTSGGTAGEYQTITAKYTYTPLMPAFSAVVKTALTETATVQVQ